MKLPLTIKVKISNLLVQNVKLRRKIEKGGLTNVRELAFTLPGLGTMALDDDFKIEICDTTPPKEERCWVGTTVGELKTALVEGKYIKNKTIDPVN
jgi:hypothetical protein